MLYIVATPIGNLQDITLRALETLKSVDKIYCEDTRQTRKLLASFSIQKPIDSYHHHSVPHKLESVITELREGKNIAYVSDAGTPGVSDPGGILVQAAREVGITVIPIPGVSAVTALLSVSGVPTNSFVFMGYVPTKKGRQTFVKQIVAATEPVVVFETAPRLVKFLNELQALGGGDHTMVIGRELTKQFEQIIEGTPDEILGQLPQPLRGEIVLLVTPFKNRATN